MYAVSVLEKQFSWTHSAWDPTEPVAMRPLFSSDNPFRFPSPGGLGRIFSSEYHDDTLGLVYYVNESEPSTATIVTITPSKEDDMYPQIESEYLLAAEKEWVE